MHPHLSAPPPRRSGDRGAGAAFINQARTVYYLRAAITSFCSGMIFISLTAYYVRTIGMDPLQLVLVGTALELTCFLFEIPTGVVADRYSRRLSMCIGGVLVGICYVLTGLVPLFAIIILAEIVRGLGSTFISGAESAWITDEVGAEAVRNVFIRRAQVDQAANLAGIWVSVLLASLLSYQVPIFLGGAGLVLLNLAMFFLMPETSFSPLPAAERSTFVQMGGILRQGLTIVRSNPLLLLLITIEFFNGAASEGFDRLAEAHYLTSMKLPVLDLPFIGPLDPITWFAIWNVFFVLTSLTLLEWGRQRLVTQHPAQAARALFTLAAIRLFSTLVFGLTRSFPLAFLADLGRATAGQLSAPIHEAWLNQLIPSPVRATILSLHSQANALGQIGGGPGVGWLGRARGIRSALVLSALLLAPILALYRRTARLPQPPAGS